MNLLGTYTLSTADKWPVPNVRRFHCTVHIKSTVVLVNILKLRRNGEMKAKTYYD